MRSEIQVNLGDRGYPIVITSGELNQIGNFARQRSESRQAHVVCDTNTESLFADITTESLARAGFSVACTALPAGEEGKSLQSVSVIYSGLIDRAADRRTLMVAVGGGVVGDIAGFAAATYGRGIPLLQVPTSLLAQVDSSVGGKVGVNFQAANGSIAKNMIGAFHQPIGVFIDTESLRTLPPEELRAGLAEVVKYGVILDSPFFSFLESNVPAILALDPAVTHDVIAQCCRLKAEVVEADEREVTDRRAILNYGHTFAHAIEAITRDYRHGEAVAIGMVAASRLAARLGFLPAEAVDRQHRLLQRLGLPTAAPRLDPAQLLEAMQHDKKAKAGKLRFVLPRQIGEVQLVDGIEVSDVQAVLDQMVQ